jgi:hypothetical protein
MNDQIKAEIAEILGKNPNISINELNKIMKISVDKYNNTGIDDFNGLSPEIMYNLLHRSWGENIIKINPGKHYGDDIPIIKQIKYFISIINEIGEIKLTKAGYLPPIIVKEIYSKKIIIDRMIELGVTKLTKEEDVDNILLTRILCDLAGIIKKRNNKISLTNNAIKIIDSNEIFEKILYAAFKKYNWAYFDYFENTEIGQFGNNYSLYLLCKYGNEWKEDDFYANLYFKAFPHIIGNEKAESSYAFYVNRTFRHMLKYFGFIEYKESKLDIGKIRTTDLFRKYITIGMYCA